MNKLIPIFLIVVCGVLFQPVEAAVVEVEVTVKSVDCKSRQISVTYETKEGSKTIDLDVCRKATISINGDVATLDSVRSGQKATITYDRELAIITKIAIGTANQSSLAKGEEDRPFIVTVGPMKTLMPPGTNGWFAFPDQQIKVLHNHPLTFLITAGIPGETGHSTYLMAGKSFGEAKPVRRLLEPGKKGEFDNGCAEAGTAFYLADRRQWLLFYHAEDHEGAWSMHGGLRRPNGYWSVGMAVWDEETNTVTKKGRVLRASIPKNPEASNSHGVGSPALVLDPSGQYLYLYYFDLTRKEPISQIGVARCAISDASKPDRWFKYYEGKFCEPGLGGKEYGIVPRACGPNVQYIRSLGCYIMLCVRACGTDIESTIPQDGGICWCYSKDGIHWSEPQLVVPGLTLPFAGKSETCRPSFVVEDEGDGSASGLLLYAYTPAHIKRNLLATSTHFVCRSIKFTKRDRSSELAEPLPQTWPTMKALQAKCRNIQMSKYGDLTAAEIRQQQLTPLDIRAVASLRTPQRLVAQECGITDEAMRYLVGLPHLEYLDLRGNPITDVSVDILCELKGLTTLDIRGTKISSEGLRRLKKALQSCQITGP